MSLSFQNSLILSAILSLTACSPASPTSASKTIEHNGAEKTAAQYPLRQHLDCLPQSAALIAAHRGTSKQRGLPENSQAALEALIDKGLLVAEIDVARSKDGVHFLFHDGVWDDKTTGKGVVAAAHWSKIEKLLLRGTEGRVTSQTPIRLGDYLALAKDHIYVEIDFKSSANYKQVIKIVRQSGMADKVILIAYSPSQAKKLAKLAPEMILSVPIKKTADIKHYKSLGIKTRNIAGWTGRGGPEKSLQKSLQAQDIIILASAPRGKEKSFAGRANIIVSDFALDQKPIIGSYNKSDYKSCLSN